MTGAELKELVDLITGSSGAWAEIWIKEAVKTGLKEGWMTLEEAKRLKYGPDDIKL